MWWGSDKLSRKLASGWHTSNCWTAQQWLCKGKRLELSCAMKAFEVSVDRDVLICYGSCRRRRCMLLLDAVRCNCRVPKIKSLVVHICVQQQLIFRKFEKESWLLQYFCLYEMQLSLRVACLFIMAIFQIKRWFTLSSWYISWNEAFECCMCSGSLLWNRTVGVGLGNSCFGIVLT